MGRLTSQFQLFGLIHELKNSKAGCWVLFELQIKELIQKLNDQNTTLMNAKIPKTMITAKHHATSFSMDNIHNDPFCICIAR